MHLFHNHVSKLSFIWQLSLVYIFGIVIFSNVVHAQNNSEQNRINYGSDYANKLAGTVKPGDYAVPSKDANTLGKSTSLTLNSGF